MSLPPIASRDAWMSARKELLDNEKDLTRKRDALNIERRHERDDATVKRAIR